MIQTMKKVLSDQEHAAFMAEEAPVWAFDASAQRMLWANAAALNFWQAETAEEFLNRDYSSDSRAVRERLEQTLNAAKDGAWFRGTWTLFPKDQPTTVALDARSYNIGSSDEAIVFRIVGALDYAVEDPDGLRMMVSARTTSVCASLFDLSGELISENPAALALRQKHEGWRKDATKLHTRYGSSMVANRILTAIARDSIEVFEFALPDTGGDQVLSVTAKRIRDPVSGNPVAHITEEDVTEKVKLAESLSELNKELEARVAERTLELERVNERLRQSQKLEILGKLTGGVAHDFNNLLAVIQGNAELMQMIGSYQEDLIEEIKTATARGAELTRALLAYARKQPLQAVPVDLRHTLAGIQGILKRTLGEDIRLSVTAAPDLWSAYVDRGQIKDVILNLALNARDAMTGGGVLALELRNVAAGQATDPDSQLDQGGEFIELTVTDTGTGMTPDVLAKATDPFFTTKSVGKGSGLGLSMIYGFSRQSGGNMVIESEVGQGTTVRIYLPRYSEQHEVSGDQANNPDMPRSKGEHIVLVEDDPAVCRFLVRSLKLLGYRITDFHSARPALDYLRASDDVDLLLSDVVLPDGMSGPALASRARSEVPGLKCLFMSGYPEGTVETNDIGEQGGKLLCKPVTSEELAKSIRAALEGH